MTEHLGHVFHVPLLPTDHPKQTLSFGEKQIVAGVGGSFLFYLTKMLDYEYC